MFRFLNAYLLQTCKFPLQSPLKIGTFSVGGGLRGGSGVRGEVVLRAANQNRSIASGNRTLVSTRVERLRPQARASEQPHEVRLLASR